MAKEWSVPFFLAAAVALGGASRAEPLFAMAVQALAAVVLICALWQGSAGAAQALPLRRWLVWLSLAFPAVAALALIPLPPGLWSALPGRAEIAQGFEAIGAPVPAAPLSLAPYETLGALGGFLPPLAMLALVTVLSWSALTQHLRVTVMLIAVASALLGLLQAFLGGDSGLYFYESTNLGWPVGFFANVNHQVTLLLMALPFAAAALSQLRLGWATGDKDLGAITFLFTAIILIVVVVLAAGSEAGYAMLGPALALSLLVYRGRAVTWRFAAVCLALAAAVVAIAFALLNSPFFEMVGLERPEALWAEDGRRIIFTHTIEAIGTYWPAGSGLGSFEQVYPRFEDARQASPTFVNMAHNDYLQVLLELGLAGLVLLVLALGWLVVASIRVWTNGDLEDVRLRRAASVALWVLAVHSLVDYPSRTAGVACFAMICAALLVKRDGGGGGVANRGKERVAAPLEI